MEKDKPLALLISGLDGTGKLYCRQTGPLSARYRVRAWEFLRRGSFSLPELAAEIARGIEVEKEKNGSMLVVGESFGGMIAMQFVLDYPEKVRNLGLINTFPFYRRKGRIRLACILAGLLQKPFVRGIKDRVAERVLAAEGIPAEDRVYYRRVIETVHLPSYCRRLELVRDVDLRSRLPEIRVPTQIFASGRDKVVPSITEARYMASIIPCAELREFPEAGHALVLTPGFSLADYF